MTATSTSTLTNECPICGGNGCQTYPLMLERWAEGRDREHWRRIHDRINGKADYPPLAEQAQNLAASVDRWVRSGFRVACLSTYRARRAVCKACPLYDAGRSRCTKCGCLMSLKPWLASETCPEGRW